jgi:hypothetical protein
VSDPQTELELHLGKVASKGQQFEVTVSLVLTQSLQVSQEIGPAVGGHLGVARALQLINLLAGAPNFPLDSQKVKEWVKQAEKANRSRNGAIHEPWVAHAETGEFSKTFFHGFRGRVASLSELEAVATTLHEATLAGRALLKMEQP